MPIDNREIIGGTLGGGRQATPVYPTSGPVYAGPTPAQQADTWAARMGAGFRPAIQNPWYMQNALIPNFARFYRPRNPNALGPTGQIGQNPVLSNAFASPFISLNARGRW